MVRSGRNPSRVWSIVAVVLFLAAPSAALRVEVILDGSGSMWASVGNETKIEVAKRVLKDLLNEAQLSEESSIGLTVYGHRRKADCDDIERFPAVAYADREQLIEVVDGVSPKGKTPIGGTLSLLAAALRGHEDATTIVLVSDGVESCGKDPCRIAREMREQYGIKVAVHVVGFDIKEGSEKLECIAKEGGGKYFAAADAGELASAFKDVRAELIRADSAPEAAPVVEESGDDENTVTLGVGSATLTARLGPTSPVLTKRESGMWQIFEPPDFEGNVKKVAVLHAAKSKVSLAAGRYLLRVAYGDASREVDLVVVDGGPSEGTVVLDAGQVKLSARLGADSPVLEKRQSGMWRVREPPDFEGVSRKVATHHEATSVATLNSGTYVLQVNYGDASKTTELTIAAGEQALREVVIGAGQLKLQAHHGDEGKMLQKRASGMWRIRKPPDFEGRQIDVAVHHEAQPVVTINAGTYDVTVKVGEVTRTRSVSLAEGEQKVVTFDLSASD